MIIVLIAWSLAVSTMAGDQPEEEFLPIGLTPEERERMDEVVRDATRTAPPPAPVRACAEWETSTGVIIRWPLGISVALVAELSEDVVVTTIVGSTSQMNSAISSYQSGGVNMDNTEFIIASTNSIWTRDYGPWFVFDADRELGIVDHVYNRPRPLDDQIPWTLGSEWGMSVYGMDLIATGGNHMCDGLNFSMSTELTYDENPDLSSSEVDSILLEYMGNDFIALDYVEYGGIHHIDCWAKFLNPTTILIKDSPVGSYSHSRLNDRADWLSQQISSWGQPYTIIRIYCPYGTAYTNSLILNDKVFVPLFNDPYDDSALAAYEAAMPGYEILGFTGSFYDDDAIHCRTMGVPDRGMLYVEHTPLSGVIGNDDNGYLISARIIAHSDSGLIPESLKVFYQTKGTQFYETPLYSTAVPDSFYGYIPSQSSGTVVDYYLQAADSSGRVETHPYIGAPWAHSFTVNSTPVITPPETLFCQSSESLAYFPDYTDQDDTVHQIDYFNYPGWLTVTNDTLTGTAPGVRQADSFMVRVADQYAADSQQVDILVYVCGDIELDDVINLLDVSFLINYLYRQGPEPYPLWSGDVNNTGEINILDVTHLINYLYMGGPPPNCP